MKQQLGHYDIVAELGRGGMGVVYKGYESSLNRYVAIKVLADSLAHDPAVKERFLREARSMAALNDPHIIQIFFIGDDAGQTFFVMEFVDGESLSSVLKREGLLRPEQAARIVYQTALGLSTAHDRGVIHRDIKPGNIMITSRGNVKIADFGIALSTQDFSKKLTSTGEFVGTPGYLSPEVCLGKPVDQRSDIFSLGIVLFEMLAGRMPFTDESPLGLMLEVVKAEIPDVCTLNAEVDPELSRILARMIAKDPADRYQSCQELVAELGRHPLLATGGTLKLQTQPSPAAATVIGMKTPVSGQVPLPRTTPASAQQALPQVESQPTRLTPVTAQPAMAAAAPPVHESVLQRSSAPAKKSSAALPLAIAAIVLLGLGAGAWAFRAQIPFLQQFAPTTEVAQTSTTTTAPATVASTTTAASTMSQTVPAATATAPPPVSTTPVTATTTAAANGSQSASAQVGSTTATVATTAPAANGATPPPPAPPTTSSSAAVPDGTPPTAAQLAAAGDASGPAPRASQVEPLKQLAAAQAASAAVQAQQPSATQIARITPPPPVADVRPHVPTIAVLSGGDIRVSEPAARVIEQALSHHGYRLLDSEMMPRTERFLGEQRNNVAGLLEMLAKGGRVDAVVIVHARPGDHQNLPAYGMNVEAMSAQLNVNVYSVSSQRKLGPGWSESVMFTGLSAKAQGEEAVQEIAPQVEGLLTEYRPGRNRG